MKTLNNTFRFRNFGTLLSLAAACVVCVGGTLMLSRGQTATARDTVTVKLVADERQFAQNDKKAKTGDKPAAGTGTFSGTVTFDGTPPTLPVLHDKGANVKDAAVCSAAAVPDESLVVDAKTKGIENVFIYLAKAPDGYKAPPVPKEPVVFDQKGCRFTPHALLARVGQTVLVKSGDAIAHNTHTFPIRSAGFNQLIKADDREGTKLVYDKSEKLPLEVKCDLHTWMRAYHLALDHPFMAVTDANGHFEITGLPPGSHKFVIWQEKAGYLNRSYSVEIKADKPTDMKLKFGPSAFKL